MKHSPPSWATDALIEDEEQDGKQKQHSKVLDRWGVRRRGKAGKHGKVRVKVKWWKWWVLAQPPYS